MSYWLFKKKKKSRKWHLNFFSLASSLLQGRCVLQHTPKSWAPAQWGTHRSPILPTCLGLLQKEAGLSWGVTSAQALPSWAAAALPKHPLRTAMKCSQIPPFRYRGPNFVPFLCSFSSVFKRPGSGCSKQHILASKMHREAPESTEHVGRFSWKTKVTTRR